MVTFCAITSSIIDFQNGTFNLVTNNLRSNINVRDFVEGETAGAATPGAFTKLQNEEIRL